MCAPIGSIELVNVDKILEGEGSGFRFVSE